MNSYCPHFTHEKTEAQRLYNLLRITQLKVGSWDLNLRSSVSEPIFQPCAVLPTPANPLVHILHLLEDSAYNVSQPRIYTSSFLSALPLPFVFPYPVQLPSPHRFSNNSDLLGILSYLGFGNHSPDFLPTSQSLFFNLFIGFIFLYTSFLALLMAPVSKLPPKLQYLPTYVLKTTV